MTLERLENLAKIGQIKAEAFAQADFEKLLASGKARLADALNQDLSFESRFDLAYNASHAIGLAALRRHGYRADNRYIVFQTLAHTLGLPAEKWRVLDQAHRMLEFGAPWCGHCIAAQPAIEAGFAGHADVHHLKIEDGRGKPLGRSFRVKLWPTLVFLRDGEEVMRLVRPTATSAIAEALAAIDPRDA